MVTRNAFGNGDLVEVDAASASIRAVARVREASTTGRLHIAFEMGEYLPWIDAEVQIRHVGNDPATASTAKILHAGSSTALLQLVAPAEAGPSSGVRPALDTFPSTTSIDEEW